MATVDSLGPSLLALANHATVLSTRSLEGGAIAIVIKTSLRKKMALEQLSRNKMKSENSSDHRLQQLITYGSSLCGMVVAAALQAFRGGMSFEFSLYTLLAAVAGLAAFVIFWKLLFSDQKTKRTKILLGCVTFILIAGGIAGVLYPLRFVASQELPNLVKGLVAATLALSGGAYLLFRCKRFFDADERRAAENETKISLK